MHLIDMSNNQANIAYVGKTPWHGLGQKMPEGAGIDEWRIAAGLDWEIERRPVFHGVIDEDGRKKAKVIEGRKALVRSDTQEALSIMSGRYKVVQPGEILEFFRDFVKAGGFEIETAGSLDGGKKVWALAKNGTALKIGGNDIIKMYLLLATACDGSMTTVGGFTSIRTVCNNTLQAGLATDGATMIRVPHSRAFDPNEVKEQLGLIDTVTEEFGDTMETLVNQSVTDKEAVNYFVELYAKRDATGELVNEKPLEKIVNKLMATYKNGPGAKLETAAGTKFGVLNAVTHFIDYETGARSNNNRFKSGQFGPGATKKAETVKMLLAA